MLIKKALILFWHLIVKPRRLEKVKDTTKFLKKCRYHQQDIEHLFVKGVFDEWCGCAEIHRGEGQNIKDAKVFIRRLM